MGKDHHYVPQFYLRNFSHEIQSHGKKVKQIGAYVMETRLSIPTAPIKGQCYRVNGYKRQDIEDELCKLEGEHSQVIKSIIVGASNYNWGVGHRAAILDFVALSDVRNANKAGNLKKLVSAMLDTRPGGDVHKAVKDEYDKHGDFILTSLKMYPDVLSSMLDLGVVVLHNSTSTDFVTSDSPVVLYNLLFQGVKGLSYRGIESTGLTIYVPLSGKTAVFLYDKNVYEVRTTSGRVINITSGSEIRKFNSLTVINAAECLYFDNSQTAAVQRLSDDLASLRKQREMVLTQSVNENDSRRVLVHGYEAFPDMKLSFPFVKIPKKIQEDKLRLSRSRTRKTIRAGSEKILYKHLSEERHAL